MENTKEKLEIETTRGTTVLVTTSSITHEQTPASYDAITLTTGEAEAEIPLPDKEKWADHIFSNHPQMPTDYCIEAVTGEIFAFDEENGRELMEWVKRLIEPKPYSPEHTACDQCGSRDCGPVCDNI